ncbi:8557_t:CDS:2 [Dentiscutata erythropus]|uniref:8557_t:CDS:1 n=1 Tax=Dentiscutata erythropus TaxID=1348616 RepID=A0A9N9NDK9_9GLOM|nr:8557_t:CDS:2 [Dentiscutata erythropus]
MTIIQNFILLFILLIEFSAVNVIPYQLVKRETTIFDCSSSPEGSMISGVTLTPDPPSGSELKINCNNVTTNTDIINGTTLKCPTKYFYFAYIYYNISKPPLPPQFPPSFSIRITVENVETLACGIVNFQA